MKIGIIGKGYVGKAIYNLFKDHYGVVCKDKEGDYSKINECDLSVVCVPTLMEEDRSCDTSIVEEVVQNLETPLILIKSTIPPGITEILKKKTGKRIVFSPEYIGQSRYWLPYKFGTDMKECPFVILGGNSKDTQEIIDILTPILGPTKTYYQVSSIESEIIKYMENSFFATKVTFVNEFKNICDIFGADFYKVREGWLLDPRINKMHTMIFKEKGFDGKCLPKDINAIVKACEKKGYEPKLLKEVIKSNERFKNE